MLGVSRSGYYDWRAREAHAATGRAAEDLVLIKQIRAVHQHFPYYGSPRVHRALIEQGCTAGRHRIARLMREHGVVARRGRRGLRPRSVPPRRRVEIIDHVQRRFDVEEPNRLWFTDATMIRTHQGWLRAVVILDAFNREVISWATSPAETPRTAIQAFADAIKIRRPEPGCVIHSDRGYQFTSHDWVNLAARHSLTVSIGERKDPRDNAVMESWFASLKNEAIYPDGTPSTHAEARSRLFDYIWDYNHRRLHSTLNYRSPIDYAILNR